MRRTDTKNGTGIAKRKSRIENDEIKTWTEPEKLELISCWAREGCTDKDIAEKMGICIRSFYYYRKKSPELDKALQKKQRNCRLQGRISTFEGCPRLQDNGIESNPRVRKRRTNKNDQGKNNENISAERCGMSDVAFQSPA